MSMSMRTEFARNPQARWLAPACALALWLGGAAPSAICGVADVAQVPAVEKVAARRDGPPRKVLVGTEVSGYDMILKLTLEQRFQRMDEIVDAMEAQASTKYPGKKLDLAVFVEYFMSRPSEVLEKQAVRFGEISERIEACARKHGCYLIVPIVLREEGEPARYSNAAVLVDREGHVAGMYRKVHPCTDLKYADLEGGITPGSSYPVFDCDFGKVGVEICYDVFYPEGWEALAKAGAEIVAFPSETPQTSRPSMYALQHRYYVVSATPRDHAAVYNPLGMIDAQATQEGDVLVHQIDLSYAITGWESGLDGGASLKSKYGDKVGYTYYNGEDAGIFWSNDPKTSIGEMFKSFGYPEPEDDTERSRMLQDKVRGGPAPRP
jgi:predicted amidohydrolase